MDGTEYIAQLEAKLRAAELEVRNCHALLALLASRTPGGVVLTDQEMANIPALGQLSIHRDDRIPGCIIMVKQEAAAA